MTKDIELRVGFDDVEKRLSIVLLKINEDEIQTFKDERDMIEQVTSIYDITLSQEEKDNVNFISELVDKYADSIAGRTRRGAANMIEVSPNTILDLSYINNKKYKIKQNNNIKDNELLLYFFSENSTAFYDCGFEIISRNSDGSINAYVAKNRKEVMSNSQDYAFLLKFH